MDMLGDMRGDMDMRRGAAIRRGDMDMSSAMREEVLGDAIRRAERRRGGDMSSAMRDVMLGDAARVRRVETIGNP